MGHKPGKPANTETPTDTQAETPAPVKLCKCCTAPAIIGKNGRSTGLCIACNALRAAKASAARHANKTAATGVACAKASETPKMEQTPVVAVGNPTKPEFATSNGYDGSISMAEFCRVRVTAERPEMQPLSLTINLTGRLLPELLESIHNYTHAISYDAEKVSLGLAKILVIGELLYNFNDERQAE